MMQLSVHLFAVVWVLVFFHFGLCQDNCRVQDGKPGESGVPGRNGWPGQKGEKGEPGLQVTLSKEELIGLKGDQGEEGPAGNIGLKGINGALGQPGPPGPTGPPGSLRNLNNGASDTKKIAFSVVRTKGGHPSYKTALIFDKELTNVNSNFDLKTGQFICSVPGIYYFVFHAVSEGNLCLQLRSSKKDEPSLNFCDFNQRKTSQVLSGGVVIDLVKDEKVWIEPFKNSDGSTESNQMATRNDMCVFSGFLIFAR